VRRPAARQARGKPYVIVFCGVNGVGKSTNLAKIAYWLGGHGVKVMIAACDTFRAGAWERVRGAFGVRSCLAAPAVRLGEGVRRAGASATRERKKERP
jgi:signal recognition particle GTPase